jgi:hypothetical protein
MTNDPAEAIIAEVERGLKNLFEKGIVRDTTGDDEASAYEAKAALTSDAQLAKGYRKLAKRARKSAK